MEFKRTDQRGQKAGLGQKSQKGWKRGLLIVATLLLLIGGFFAWKAGFVLNKISSNGNVFGTIVHMIPGVQDELKGEKEGRINMLLLGMRGENVPGGGTLADTIMVASIDPKNNQVAMLSIPRDLYVDNPAVGYKTKINAVYAYGEENGKKEGLEQMEKVVGDIVGMEIPYGLVINFQGFTDLVNAIGGVEITLDSPFQEAMQFNEEHVCDSYVFTVPTGNYETKTKKTPSGRERVVKQYPLCTNPNTECGGNFSLPAGKQTLSGEQALCYARSRKTSNDFERAKRQQLIIQKIKEKSLAVGTLSDFGKVNDMIDALGNNVKSDLQGWEMKRFYEIQQQMVNMKVVQRVLESNEEGLLYTPSREQYPDAGSILLPIGDNYDRIRALFRDIFTVPEQTDIKPKS